MAVVHGGEDRAFQMEGRVYTATEMGGRGALSTREVEIH